MRLSSFMRPMGLAKRRHHNVRAFVRRSKHWKAIAFPWTTADGSLKPAPVSHFLKSTARSCSCYVCKRPRYKRESQQWAVVEL